MKTIRIATTLILLLLVITATRCGKDDGGGGTFIPDLSRQWTNKADPTNVNTFFFLDAPADVNTGSFTGNENPLGGGTQYNFSGSFNNRNIQFTYNATSGVKSNKSYSGTINDASTVITLNSDDLGSLILEKR